MELNEFARIILHGTTLDEKLAVPSPLTDHLPGPTQTVPAFPGRPPKLARVGKAGFPALHQLSNATTRGQVLHFFANHELLAMEIMALVLLRFPDAPTAFRMGVARTILEEQSHMRLYIERMRELGVDFGDLPVSDYFWKTMREMRSPMDFVVQMSLTFEQANLDFSLFYRDEILKTGDARTGEILDQVYREEIGHVKHGVHWFNRWREPSHGESDWQAYRRLLPPPMTPRRAKGASTGYCKDSRRAAGLSETFIEELEIYNGPKGRPPVVWIYNPSCDAEIARGTVGHTPNAQVLRLCADLETLPMHLTRDQDILLVSRRPTLAWIRYARDHGMRIPEFVEEPGGPAKLALAIKEHNVGGLQPWGWSPDAFEAARAIKDRFTHVPAGNARWCQAMTTHERFADTGIGPLFSKCWSVRFLRDWMAAHPELQAVFGDFAMLGQVYSDTESALSCLRESLNRNAPMVVKAPYGTAGAQTKRLMSTAELNAALEGWIRNTVRSQGAVVIEPLLDKLHDFSLQLEVLDEGIRVFEARRFLTGSRLEFRGTVMGRRTSTLGAEIARFLHEQVFERWHELATHLGKELRAAGYLGPVGIDALLWRDTEGALRFKPVVEVNPRWTMGRVALELEALLVPETPAAWVLVPVRDIIAGGFGDPLAFARALEARYPIRRGASAAAGTPARIESGVLWTNDPALAREALTVVVAGEALFESFFAPYIREASLVP